PRLAAELVALRCCHASHRQQRQLLRLVLGQRRAALEPIAIVFGEPLGRRHLRRRRRLGLHHWHPGAGRAGAVHVAGDQHDGRIVVTGAAAVRDGRPGSQIGVPLVGGQYEDVIGGPGEGGGGGRQRERPARGRRGGGVATA